MTLAVGLSEHNDVTTTAAACLAGNQSTLTTYHSTAPLHPPCWYTTFWMKLHNHNYGKSYFTPTKFGNTDLGDHIKYVCRETCIGSILLAQITMFHLGSMFTLSVDCPDCWRGWAAWWLCCSPSRPWRGPCCSARSCRTGSCRRSRCPPAQSPTCPATTRAWTLARPYSQACWAGTTKLFQLFTISLTALFIFIFLVVHPCSLSVKGRGWWCSSITSGRLNTGSHPVPGQSGVHLPALAHFSTMSSGPRP